MNYEVPCSSKSNIHQPEIRVVSVAVPLLTGSLNSSYEVQKAHSGKISFSDQVHLNLNLGKSGSEVFLQIRNALRINNAKTANGKPVYSNSDTIRWLIEQTLNQTSKSGE